MHSWIFNYLSHREQMNERIIIGHWRDWGRRKCASLVRGKRLLRGSQGCESESHSVSRHRRLDSFSPWRRKSWALRRLARRENRKESGRGWGFCWAWSSTASRPQKRNRQCRLISWLTCYCQISVEQISVSRQSLLMMSIGWVASRSSKLNPTWSNLKV